MNVKFCSIDAALISLGISVMELMTNGEYKIHKVSTLHVKSNSKHTRWERKVFMLDLFVKWVEVNAQDVSFFVFENYSYRSNGHLADLGELNGLLKKHIHDLGKPFDVNAPSSVKKIITGKGNSPKSIVQDSVCSFLTEEVIFKNSDESDSVAIGVAYSEFMLSQEKK